MTALEYLVPDPEQGLRRKFFGMVSSFMGTTVLDKDGAVVGVLYAANKRGSTGCK